MSPKIGVSEGVSRVFGPERRKGGVPGDCVPRASPVSKKCSMTLGLGGSLGTPSGHPSDTPEAWRPKVGHTPSTAGTFRKKYRRNSGKTPETLSEFFLELPSRVRLGSPKPYNSRHLKAPEQESRILSPPVRLGGRFFFSKSKWFRRGLLRAGHGIPSSTGGIFEKGPRDTPLHTTPQFSGTRSASSKAPS